MKMDEALSGSFTELPVANGDPSCAFVGLQPTNRHGCMESHLPYLRVTGHAPSATVSVK